MFLPCGLIRTKARIKKLGSQSIANLICEVSSLLGRKAGTSLLLIQEDKQLHGMSVVSHVGVRQISSRITQCFYSDNFQDWASDTDVVSLALSKEWTTLGSLLNHECCTSTRCANLSRRLYYSLTLLRVSSLENGAFIFSRPYIITHIQPCIFMQR